MTARTIPGLKQGVPIGLLAAGGFASSSGSRILDPLLPPMAADLGVSVAGASSVVAAFMVTYGAGQLAVGPLGDRFGKVRIVCAALVAYGLVLLGGLFVDSLGALIGLRALAGLFAGAVIPLSMAHIGDSIPYADRQIVISRFLTGIVLAQLVTGPISGIIGQALGWRGSFAALGAASLSIAALLALRLGRGTTGNEATASRAGFGLAGYARLLERPAGRSLLLLAFIDGILLFGGAFPFVGAFLIDTFGLSPARAGLVVACFGGGAFIYTRAARPLLRWFGEPGLLLLGGAGLAAGLGLLAAAGGWPMAAAAQALLGLSFYTFHGVLQARATEALPDARGVAVSAFALALFLGQSVGSLAFGVILGAAGYRAGFAVAAVAMLALGIFAARPAEASPPLTPIVPAKQPDESTGAAE